MSSFISHFSPQRSSPEDLEKILVQREALLSASVAKIRTSVVTASKHHLLFVGPRGSGKTNLIALIQHRLQQLPELEATARYAWLNEDETSSTFLKLLLRIYRALAARYSDEFTLSIATELYGKEPDDALRVLEHALLTHLGTRTCVVLIENLDALFDTMNEGELRRWRAWVQNHPVTTTVGTAQRLFDGVSKRDHVFFGFFDTQHLRPLSPEDARELLKKLALHGEPSDAQRALHAYLETPKGLARLNAIHHLTGGNPRLYLILADFLTHDTLDALVPAFEKMADQQLTPYYQERLRWLSPQQREIVEYLCQQQHPIVPVKTIAAALFAEHSSIAGQLKKLREMGYVVGRARGREVYYELAEPLMRLSFQVKEAAAKGAGGPAPLRMIVDMLRIWFEQKQLEATLSALKPDAAGRDYFALALAENLSSPVSLRVDIILRRSLDGVDTENCSDDEFASLDALAEESGEIEDLVRFALVCDARKNGEKSVSVWTKIIDHSNSISKDVVESLRRRAVAYIYAKNYEAALIDLTQIVDHPSASEVARLGAVAVRSAIFDVINRYEEALADIRFLATWETPERIYRLMHEIAPEIRSEFLVRTLFAFSTSTHGHALIAEFVGYWAKFDLLPQLGAALVAHLPAFKASPLKPEALRAWHASWVEASQGYAELEMPLKLLETGLIYFETGDEGELLRLPSEQRSLLRQALKLPVETEAL